MKQEQEQEQKLNLGCGDNKIPGFINIDACKDCEPDLVLDFTKHSLPFKQNSISFVLLSHCIEHIQKRLHPKILTEIARVLKPECKVYISYPNFWECAKRWHNNTGGQKAFWEATLYGRQLYPGDYHVCAMDPDALTDLLYDCGFKDVVSFAEAEEPFNSVTTAIKNTGGAVQSYETIVAQDMHNMIVKGV